LEAAMPRFRTPLTKAISEALWENNKLKKTMSNEEVTVYVDNILEVLL
jgi:hypothetical protein